MGYRVKPFTMSVRNNSTQEFVDVGLLGSDVDANVEELNLKTPWVTPEMFGAKGDGVTDDTIAIQEAINACINEKRLLMLNKNHTYLIKSQLNITDYIDIEGNGARIKAGDSMNYVLYFSIYPKYDDSGETDVWNRTDIEGNSFVRNIVLDCNSLATNGLRTSGYMVWFDSITVINVNGIGLDLNGISHFAHVHVTCNPTPNSIGVRVWSGDNYLTDIVVVDAKEAYVINKYVRLQHSTAWIKTPSQYPGSVFFHDINTDMSLIYTIIECYIDTYQTMFKADKRLHDPKFICCRYQMNDEVTDGNTEDSYLLYGVNADASWFQNVVFSNSVFIGNINNYTQLCNAESCRANFEINNTFIHMSKARNSVYNQITPPAGVTAHNLRVVKQGTLTHLSIDVTINVPATDATSNYNIVTLGKLIGYLKPLVDVNFAYDIRVTGANEYYVTRFYGGKINATNGNIMLMIPNDLLTETAMRATVELTFMNPQIHTMAITRFLDDNT